MNMVTDQKFIYCLRWQEKINDIYNISKKLTKKNNNVQSKQVILSGGIKAVIFLRPVTDW